MQLLKVTAARTGNLLYLNPMRVALVRESVKEDRHPGEDEYGHAAVLLERGGKPLLIEETVVEFCQRWAAAAVGATTA